MTLIIIFVFKKKKKKNLTTDAYNKDDTDMPLTFSVKLLLLSPVGSLWLKQNLMSISIYLKSF